MDHAPFVGGLERLGDLCGQFEGFFQRNRAVPQAGRKGFAFDELKHKEARAFMFLQPGLLRSAKTHGWDGL